MAHARRSPQHRAPSSSISSPSTTRRHTLRRPSNRSPAQPQPPVEFISSPLPKTNRPALVPLQPNLRRLPSRIHLAEKDVPHQLMRESSHVTTGSKRKRVVSSNENAHTHGRPTRGSGRPKRLRTDLATTTRYHQTTSEESPSEASDMDVDGNSVVEMLSNDSEDEEAPEEEEQDEDELREEDDDSSDDYLINFAPPKRLNKLRKADLVRLYELAGLVDDGDKLTKSDIINAIVNNRDEFASVPPSSPPGRPSEAGTSEESSDDGHFAGDEETDAGGFRRASNGNQLKRRITLHDIPKSPSRPLKSRSLSMGNLLGLGEPPKPLALKRNASVNANLDQASGSTTRRKVSTRSSSTSATNSSANLSPPATRLRSRTASMSVPTASTSNSVNSKSKGKGKAKQVEFNDAVEVHVQTPLKPDEERESVPGFDSDLTELEDSEPELKGQPSPRRLRSKDKERETEKAKGKDAEDHDATPVAPAKQRRKPKSAEGQGTEVFEGATGRKLRVTPMRRAKRIGSFKESESEGLEEEDELEHDEEEEGGEEQEEAGAETQEEEEVDELVSSASITPPPELRGRRTPVRSRLRPRRTRKKATPTLDEENEGDDEEEAEVAEDEEGGGEEEDENEDGEEDEEEVEEEAVEQDDDDEATIAVEPRKLRNGKIVGEECTEMDVDEESVRDEEAEEDGVEEDEREAEEVEEEIEGEEDEGIDVDAEGETDEDERMEDDVDLTVATAKTLVRMRRNDLVRLCETREIDPSGTKPQLAEALLQWRDRQANDFSSPSSAGTIRPSSGKKRRRKTHSDATSTGTAVLMRSNRQHTDEPRTPVPGKEKESEELELDLESLGLEDREIPPEKLTKLEKIGSGGFKDVFIGKFKGRKIAISEFRGQLSAMDIKELKLLGAFNHPNIVRFLGVSIPENTKETPVMIVSELCSNGDLFDYIRNTNAPSLHKVLTMMLDIARGLEYLHTRKPSIIHRDCKSSNILITARGTAKIADFGLAKVKQSTRSMVRSLVGTVNWQAPELWHAHPKYNHKVDAFSCAMVFWEMLQWHAPTKKFPWEGMNEHAIYEVVGTKRQRPSIAGLRKQWCPEIVDLIERMWAQEHQDRPTMTQVVESLEDLVARY